jgi:hypothetical protein
MGAMLRVILEFSGVEVTDTSSSSKEREERGESETRSCDRNEERKGGSRNEYQKTQKKSAMLMKRIW